ncbi:hypothetical protein FACS1894161_0920 [Spirochaetia bacterium]|nr:hypothetical protein FACS1894161_0920 [Spirochaetia bacterium]
MKEDDLLVKLEKEFGILTPELIEKWRSTCKKNLIDLEGNEDLQEEWAVTPEEYKKGIIVCENMLSKYWNGKSLDMTKFPGFQEIMKVCGKSILAWNDAWAMILQDGSPIEEFLNLFITSNDVYNLLNS